MLQVQTRASLLGVALLLTACGPTLEGRFEDVKDPGRYYSFTSWGQKWSSYYGDSGMYKIEGTRLIIEGSGGITGEVIGPDEIHLEDVSTYSSDVPHTVYRRVSE